MPFLLAIPQELLPIKRIELLHKDFQSSALPLSYISGNCFIKKIINMKICKIKYLNYSNKLKIKVLTKYEKFLYLRFYGPLGHINYKFRLQKNYILLKKKNKILFFLKSKWTLDLILCKQAFIGLLRGYKTILSILGRGYKTKLTNKGLVLNLGYSHLIFFKLPKPISIEEKKYKKKNLLLLKSNNSQVLNQTVFLLKSLRKLNVYKEKGIKINSEIYILKEGKKNN
jgi:large subunit ribosomal protein L6